MAVKLDKDKIFDGIWKAKDLAELLDISPKTFSNKRQYWLEIIRRYVDIEELGGGKYLVSAKIDEKKEE